MKYVANVYKVSLAEVGTFEIEFRVGLKWPTYHDQPTKVINYTVVDNRDGSILKQDWLYQANKPKPKYLPHISGYINVNEKVIQIENVVRRAILPGQHFLGRTLTSLLSLEPDTHSILLSNVTHYETLNRLKCIGEPGLPVILKNGESPGPLISALRECGFPNLFVELEDTFYWGIRGYR